MLKRLPSSLVSLPSTHLFLKPATIFFQFNNYFTTNSNFYPSRMTSNSYVPMSLSSTKEPKKEHSSTLSSTSNSTTSSKQGPLTSSSSSSSSTSSSSTSTSKGPQHTMKIKSNLKSSQKETHGSRSRNNAKSTLLATATTIATTTTTTTTTTAANTTTIKPTKTTTNAVKQPTTASMSRGFSTLSHSTSSTATNQYNTQLNTDTTNSNHSNNTNTTTFQYPPRVSANDQKHKRKPYQQQQQNPNNQQQHQQNQNTYSTHSFPKPAFENIREWKMFSPVNLKRDPTFTFMTYNILADKLLWENSYLYKKASRAACSWKYRRENLLKEILTYRADIICLQEVDHYPQFRYHLNQEGYSGTFIQRSGEEMEDGCAIFYNRQKFKLHQTYNVPYFIPGSLTMDKHNVGLICILKYIDDSTGGSGRFQHSRNHSYYPNQYHTKHQQQSQQSQQQQQQQQDKYVIVASTHLLYNPKRGDIKLLQLMSLFAEIQHAKQELSAYLSGQQKKKGFKKSTHQSTATTTTTTTPTGSSDSIETLEPSISVVLCGDLNLAPNCSIYNFIVDGQLNYSGLSRSALSGQLATQEKFFAKQRNSNNNNSSNDRNLNLNLNHHHHHQNKNKNKNDSSFNSNSNDLTVDNLETVTAGASLYTYATAFDSITSSTSYSGLTFYGPPPDIKLNSALIPPELPIHPLECRWLQNPTADGNELSTSTLLSSSSATTSSVSSELVVSHPFKFHSAYDFIDENGEDCGTTINEQYDGTVDYIFFEDANLQLVNRLELLSVSKIREISERESGASHYNTNIDSTTPSFLNTPTHSPSSVGQSMLFQCPTLTSSTAGFSTDTSPTSPVSSSSSSSSTLSSAPPTSTPSTPSSSSSSSNYFVSSLYTHPRQQQQQQQYHQQHQPRLYGLPCSSFSSDHVCLMTRFRFK